MTDIRRPSAYAEIAVNTVTEKAKQSYASLEKKAEVFGDVLSDVASKTGKQLSDVANMPLKDFVKEAGIAVLFPGVVAAGHTIDSINQNKQAQQKQESKVYVTTMRARKVEK